MKRRTFLALLGGSVAALPLPVRAQLVAMPVVGYLDAAAAQGRAPFVAALREGLKEVGFVEGQNVTLAYRWADNQIDRLPDLAAELVRKKVNVIAVGGNIAAQKVQAATGTIPIVFVVGNDPIKLGLVNSLSNPGGNLTGVTPLNAELGPKRLEVLHELAPAVTSVALLVNPGNPIADALPRELEAAARTIGLKLHVVRAGNDQELDEAFATLTRIQAGALLIGADTFFNGRTDRLAALALRYRLPTIYQTRQFAAAGGLMSYGASITDAFRIAGVYAGRILKGEKPGGLPVQQATRIELVVNLKTAMTLGVTVPTTLLARADEVIE